MKTRIERLASGFRICFIQDPVEQGKAYGEMFTQLADETYATIGQAMMSTEWYVDDWMRPMPPTTMLFNAMQQGELIAGFLGSKLVGIALITNIIREREASLSAWVLPEFRGKFCLWRLWKEIVSYCFRPLKHPDETIPLNLSGLGVRKLKATISSGNLAAINACKVLHFWQVGRSPADALYSGVVTDTLMVELPNPLYFPETINVRQQQTAGTTRVHAASPVPSTGTVRKSAKSRDNNTRSVDAWTGDEPRRRGRKQTTGVVTVKQQSNGTGRDKPIRAELLQPKRRTRAGSKRG